MTRPHNEPQPLIIKQVQIDHMNAADMAKKIAMRAPHALTQCVSYYPLPKENQIRIKAKAKALHDLMQWIHANDQLPKQIALHTLLFSSNADQQHALGFTTTENGPLSGLLSNVSKHSMPWLHTLPSLSPSQLKVALDLLESKGMGMMVAQPQLITCDQQTALLEAGSEIPMKRYHKEIEEIHFKQLMLSLALTPHYQTDGYMALHIKLHEQRPGNINAQGIPGIITHHLVTNIHIANKQTVAIGGLSTTDYMNHKSCIPILHHLPVLGPLFCHTQRTQHKAQLWIFITPEILNNANTPHHAKPLSSPKKHIVEHTK